MHSYEHSGDHSANLPSFGACQYLLGLLVMPNSKYYICSARLTIRTWAHNTVINSVLLLNRHCSIKRQRMSFERRLSLIVSFGRYEHQRAAVVASLSPALLTLSCRSLHTAQVTQFCVTRLTSSGQTRQRTRRT